MIPISVGQRSDSYRTVFRAEVGQFLGPIGMVSDRNRNGVRMGPEWCPTGIGIAGRKEWSDAVMSVRVAARFS